MGSENRGRGFLRGFVLGAIAGGAVAVLLSQEETRDLLVGKAREAGNLAMDASGDLRGRFNDVASQWHEGAADMYERGRAIVENARANSGGEAEN
ncbi:MAG TPA: YtxH domain-containing protein [Candidatus Baltobacteraceae bacterium]|nr:YtxH domain-containing protein [Candidatus Baltobacteraceae bacterium]